MIKLVVNIRHSRTLPTLLTAVYFNEVQMNFKYDSVASTFKLQLYFDPENEVHAELAAVSHIHECKIYYVHDKPGRYAVSQKRGKAIFQNTTDELIFTGFMLSQSFTDGPKPSFMEIGGYSKPGVLGDCDFPTKAFPLESNGLTFRQIVNQKVLPYFSDPASGGFKFYVKSSRADSTFETTKSGSVSGMSELKAILANLDDESDTSIEKTTAPESKNILSYLKELAIQKGLILSTDIFGNLLVNAAYTGDNYLCEFGTQNGVPFTDMFSNYNGQGLHSDIEVVGQPDKDGGNMAYALISNPLVPVVYRPKVVTMPNGTDNDAMKAAIAERGTELKSIVLKILLASPVANGKFILPNNTIKVKNKKVYLYTANKWFIEEVVYTKNADGEKCELTCVLPGVYDSKTPINVFVKPGENLGGA